MFKEDKCRIFPGFKGIQGWENDGIVFILNKQASGPAPGNRDDQAG